MLWLVPAVAAVGEDISEDISEGLVFFSSTATADESQSHLLSLSAVLLLLSTEILGPQSLQSRDDV